MSDKGITFLQIFVFSVYQWFIIEDINCSNICVSVGNDTASILAYAADIVLLLKSEAQLQPQLNMLHLLVVSQIEDAGKWF